MLGIALAAGLRILFAIVATYLLAIKRILLIGGLLLSWVCWRFYKDLHEFNSVEDLKFAGIGEAGEGGENKLFGHAFLFILLADVSMSIDSIVAVAAIARYDILQMIFSLTLAIAVIALFASVIIEIMLRHSWLFYCGLTFFIYLAMAMTFDGAVELELISGFGAGDEV